MIVHHLLQPKVNLNARCIYTSCVTLRSHYDSLGITPKATQTDIKTAYYKLSKVYHPDKNKGCADASKKFQDISSAYEVLGNFKLRRLYDKGLLHTAGPAFEHPQESYPEHPQAKFYESRQRHHNMTSSSGTPVYDFDEWSRAHYGATFERANRAKQRWEQKQSKIKQDKVDVKNEKVIITFVSLLFMSLCFSYLSADRNLDNVERRTS